jgi:RNA polymerase sigma-70 factor (ECF subfamily)
VANRDDEHRLVLEARAGDREAFGALVSMHWNRWVRLARSVVGEASAEDVVQEALLIDWRKLPRLSAPASFGAWITRIVYRRCLRSLRRRAPEASPESSSEPREAARSEIALWVEQLLTALAPRQRAVMHLTVVEGRTDREIADLLGITAASVRAHRRRGRQRLEKLIGEGHVGSIE